MKISIETIPHSSQRYDTCGDWFREGEVTKFKVSKLPDWRYEFLIAVHEMVEWALCTWLKISEEEVSRFDLEFEKERARGEHTKEDEPGDDSRSPYRVQHFIATTVERMVGVSLGVNLDEYDQAVMALDYPFPPKN